MDWIIEVKDFFGEEKFSNLNNWVIAKMYARQPEPFSECGKIHLLGGYMKFGDVIIKLKDSLLIESKCIKIVQSSRS